MRMVTVQAPQGHGARVAEVALAVGVTEAAVYQVHAHRAGEPAAVRDVVEVLTATPIAKRFIEELMAVPFYAPATYSFAVVHPRSVFANEPPREETRPIFAPTEDVYEELWQFSRVTVSLVGRVFLAALLLAYGMIEMIVPLLIAGLLFLPYHHQMLSIGLGVWMREWRLVGQGAWALIVSTSLVVAAGTAVALLTEPPLRFEEFGSPLTGFLIALIIGIAAALATADDAGRRELIGLAATAHIVVLPAWFGIALIFGFPDATTVVERLLSFAIAVATLTGAALGTYALLGMRGEGVQRFISGIR